MKSFVRVIPVLSALAATIAMGVAPRHAAAQTQVPKEVLALVDDLSDIDKLRVLNPLDLKADQLGQIIDTVNKSREIYIKRVTEVAVPPMRDMAAEIKGLRKKLLTGGQIPADFDKRVKKIQSDFVERRDAEEQTALKSLSGTIRAILTKAQFEKAISTARKLTEKDGKPSKATDDQFFNYYIKGIFMDYVGIVKLLEDMKAAREGATGSAEADRSAASRKVARK